MHETNSPKRARIRRRRAVQERTPKFAYREPVLVPREGCVSALRSPIPISESRVEAKQIQCRNVSHRDANCELKRQTPTVMTTPTRAVRLDGAASARGAPRGSCGVRLGRWDSKERAAQGCILFVARITENPTRLASSECCGRDFETQKCKSRTPRAEPQPTELTNLYILGPPTTHRPSSWSSGVVLREIAPKPDSGAGAKKRKCGRGDS